MNTYYTEIILLLSQYQRRSFHEKGIRLDIENWAKDKLHSGKSKSQFVNEKARMMVSILEVVCAKRVTKHCETLDSVPYVIQNMFNFDLHCDSWSQDTIVDYKLHLESFIVHRHRYRRPLQSTACTYPVNAGNYMCLFLFEICV